MNYKIEEKMKLFFCYNANSGLINGILDFLHKTLKPKTYQCNLCAITYTFKMKKNWLKFIDNLAYEVNFVHLNHLKDYNLESFYYKTPCCLLKDGDEIKIIIDKTKMSFLKSENDLINELKKIEVKYKCFT